MTGIGGRSIELNRTAHKTDLRTRTKTMRFHPFVFTGKEKDHESGIHHYGARCRWSELLTGWLSVDLMMDMFPEPRY